MALLQMVKKRYHLFCGNMPLTQFAVHNTLLLSWTLISQNMAALLKFLFYDHQSIILLVMVVFNVFVSFWRGRAKKIIKPGISHFLCAGLTHMLCYVAGGP